ncbi:hypothetical protein AMECASPLE_025538 [Ameca splendens]|uniref:Secreted protein n=2 Tax=Goodeidae TaxID=28758 RepID=A0ABU7A7P2_9TELE|nr:hypothetical protein [Ataeniobius toweri]
MFALLLIWMPLHGLASFALLKTQFISLSELQTDGGKSAWLSLRSCESCFFFLARFIWGALTGVSLCIKNDSSHLQCDTSLRGCKIFLPLHTIFLRALRGDIFV